METEVVMDPTTGEIVYLENGVEVRRWLPDFSLLGGGGGGSGQSTSIAPDGTLVQPQTAPLDPLAAPPATEGATTTATSPDDWAAGPAGGTSGGYRGGGGYSRTSGGGYASGYATGGFGGYGDDPFAALPNYQNGQRHPAAGGAPLVPGGQFAAQDDGYDNRQQVSVPGGATAGPFAVRAAPMPTGYGDNGAYGGGSSWNDQGRQGGGGGANMGANSALGQNLAGKVRGMAGAIQGGGGGEMTTDRQYKRQGRRMDRAYDRFNAQLADPEPMPVRGWSKRQGYKPGTIDAVLANPAIILPDVFDGFNANQFTDSLTDLPMTDLAILAGGTRNRHGLMSRPPRVKVPRILRQQGVRAPKPEDKRQLDASKVANRIAKMYRQIGGDGTKTFDTEALLGNMATAKKNSALRQGLDQQFAYDPGGALDSISGYIQSAIFGGMGNTGQSRALARTADRRLIEMGGKALRKKPERASKIANRIARSFLD